MIETKPQSFTLTTTFDIQSDLKSFIQLICNKCKVKASDISMRLNLMEVTPKPSIITGIISNLD